MTKLIQLLFTGLTVGATYSLAALGFSIIYNASGVINFAQGEFLMLGGMIAVFLTMAGAPLLLAIVAAVAITAIVGLLVEKFAIEPARGADVTAIVIITIGVSNIIRGAIEITLGKGAHALPHFSGDRPIGFLGAAILPQSLWVMAATLLVVVVTGWFFSRTRLGKGMLATSHNRMAAQLVGVDTERVLLASFGLSAALGAIGGVLIAPISTTSYDIGLMLGLKGFVAATLGGLGSGMGVVAGGLLLGLLETMTAGYVSSSYKDAVPFVLVLVILVFRPRGLFGLGPTTRV